MRLIDADAVLRELKSRYPSMPFFKELREKWAIRTEGYLEAEEIIWNAPTIDAVSVVQGEWIPATWQDEHCPERLKRHKCSECGQRAKQILVRTELVDNYYCNKAEPITEYTHEEQLSKFCPNCGAKMKGADNDI